MNGKQEVPWFLERPELLERELRALRDCEASVEVDGAARAEGVIRLRIELSSPDAESEGERLKLTAVYPDAFPYFRPEVYASELDLPRHQHPFQKNLCLLPRPSQFWNVEWTLADYLQEQLGRVLEAGRVTDPAAIAANPDEQAEPISEFYSVVQTAPVLLDDSFVGPDFGTDERFSAGTVLLGLPSGGDLPLRMAALELRDARREILCNAPTAIAASYPRHVRGAWFRLSDHPPGGDPEEIFQWLIKRLREEGRTQPSSGADVKLQGATLHGVIGVAFPEEVEPGKLGWGWLFLVRASSRRSLIGPQGRQRGKPQWERVSASYLAPAARVSREAFLARIPKLSPLRDRTIAVVGLGALGAPSAIEFARSGVGRLRLLDFDVVDPPTTVRWPLGLSAAGMLKPDAIERFVRENYPHTEVEVVNHRVGAIRLGENGLDSRFKPEREVLDEIFDVDLVYDASAEEGVSHLLSAVARRRGIAFVALDARRGAWGGLVMRELPGKTEGCWMCLQHALTDGTIPPPPQDPSGGIQPLGCGDPTFTGTSFDLLNITLAGVRLAVSTLCEGTPDAYPALDWDVGIVELVDEDGRPVAPRWRTEPLSRHEACPYH